MACSEGDVALAEQISLCLGLDAARRAAPQLWSGERWSSSRSLPGFGTPCFCGRCFSSLLASAHLSRIGRHLTRCYDGSTRRAASRCMALAAPSSRHRLLPTIRASFRGSCAGLGNTSPARKA
ncbi:rpl-38 [Symbiodinium sp. CCMP2456]|nr:rpl-38 [Symbiodinium sp. CCMP2456]